MSESKRYHEGTELNQIGYIFKLKSGDDLGSSYMVTHIEGKTAFLSNNQQIGRDIIEDNKYKLVGKLTFEELNL